ncbi:cytochrome P450 [Actinomadura macrotermitis]|uniref:Mycinamicin IV hydroxylase/epoxidase n=1 Tax=Actinomadura macrotermitis TaxID=2585200 RepID=A0A7K0BVH7_9ACTN|nr:cytochrome P450 [Actinomadura macrotermitis]MQY05076.1 Mycinamicin IV hydroxylase/epoxidase [Actinomadura macrotermitis]
MSSESETCPYPFDDPEALDLHPRYRELREQPGMARVQMAYGRPAWLATRYQDVRTVLGDPRFSRARAVGDDEPRKLPFASLPTSLFAMDPPDHTRLRRAVAKAFTMRRVESLRPGVQKLADGLLDDMRRQGPPADLVQGFSLPLSIMVICNLLGVPYEDRPTFRGFADIITVNDPGLGVSLDQIIQAHTDLHAYLGRLVAAKRAEPADDLLTVLAQEKAEDLSDEEIIGIGVDVLIAGHESTGNFISNFCHLLLTNPDRLAELRDDPGRVPQAVEELLRMTPLGANAFMARVATEDVQVGDVTVRAGEAVLPAMASANRDAGVFADPDTLDFSGRDTPHLTFGHGAHHCLGAQLGRMELQIAVRSLLAAFPDLRLAVPPEEVRWRSAMLIRGPWELPVAW